MLTRQIGDCILHTRTRDVDFSKDQIKIAQDFEKMIETLRYQRGVGIASNQCADIEDPMRMTIIGTDNKEIRQAFAEAFPEENLPLPFVMINPEVLEYGQETYYPDRGEGCLSVLGAIRGMVERYRSLTVRYFDFAGNEKTSTFTGFPAHIVQHELDHINNGLLYLERILTDFSKKQKEDLLKYIQLHKEGNLEKENDKDPTQTLGFSFDRDEEGKVVFCPDAFKQILKQLSPEVISGIEQKLQSFM